MLPKLSPLPLKERSSMVFLEKGRLDVLDGSFVLVDVEGVRVHVPVGGVCCILLEPGIRVSHAAVTLAARSGTLLVWVGEAGVRLYAAGQPGGARSDKLLWQASLALDDTARLNVVRRMFEIRFGGNAPGGRSVEQLRGMEGARVRAMYKQMAKLYRVAWSGRRYDPGSFSSGDVPNQCLSAATSCLYGISEAAILAAGYAPAIGFLHTGKPRSFVYDIADLIKFETVVPAAFGVAAGKPVDPERETRIACRDMFRKKRVLKRIIPLIEEVLAAGGKNMPEPAPEAAGPAFEEEKGHGDDGHRG
ncbi:type I-E CRISPR-associated endonuclease Cas1e [Pseudodesulfovibrio senegalensis]|uniref:CRISPR-associated endonuclease Cas1 n=1 Tax=Pseudodesulfovibrio senegalensis TaxID=1721087 RepID=A0A6N6N5X5_9BACT|nr:type I-E CRISPR-associated endonuclease Cas1e [Pseudodesulfovibrio senegalensis]KAB1442879.1 type I-E CRISPR-associated endonuclease Cas1 [Pseudodesulfovibrio senegalensis]